MDSLKSPCTTYYWRTNRRTASLRKSAVALASGALTRSCYVRVRWSWRTSTDEWEWRLELSVKLGLQQTFLSDLWLVGLHLVNKRIHVGVSRGLWVCACSWSGSDWLRRSRGAVTTDQSAGRRVEQGSADSRITYVSASLSRSRVWLRRRFECASQSVSCPSAAVAAARQQRLPTRLSATNHSWFQCVSRSDTRGTYTSTYY